MQCWFVAKRRKASAFTQRPFYGLGGSQPLAQSKVLIQEFSHQAVLLQEATQSTPDTPAPRAQIVAAIPPDAFHHDT